MRGLPWLVGAGALVGAGGWLMTSGDPASTTAAAARHRDTLAFPTYQRPAELTRETERRTLAAASAPEGTSPTADGVKAAARDPLLIALAPDATTALVFEAGTILHAPVGQAMLACVSVTERARMESHAPVPGKTWLDLADRVGFSRSPAGELVAMQGSMADIDFARFVPEATSRAPRAGVKRLDVDRPDGRGELHLAVWHDAILLVSKEGSLVETAVQRLDTGGSGAKGALAESEAYGEIYGIVGADDLEALAPPELKGRLREVAAHAEVHVDAIDEVLLVVDMQGSDASQVLDLGKSMGAAMAVARLEAKREGEDALVRLMDLSRVRPYGEGRLRAEVAIPTDLMTKSMKGCAR